MAGLRELLTCAECSKQKREIKKHPRKEIINFNGRNLCPNCYKQAKENEEFKIFICELFGVKSPGPKIYSQRKRLKEQYGFSDTTIMRTLEYIFRVKKMNKAFESLGLVTPAMVEEAHQYYLSQKGKVVELREVKTVEHIVPIKEAERKKNLLSYDFLED